MVLPDVSSSLSFLEAQLNYVGVLSVWRERSWSRKVIVYLPRFKLEESFVLNDQLIKMGMSDLFSVQHAYLSGIISDRDLYICV